jgi:hypothetical protein
MGQRIVHLAREALTLHVPRLLDVQSLLLLCLARAILQ